MLNRTFFSCAAELLKLHPPHGTAPPIIAQMKRIGVEPGKSFDFDQLDPTGKPLDGANKYTIHFDRGATPLVNAFWSITLYDSNGFEVANVLNRFAVSSLMPFKFNTDGSLDLYFQIESSGKEKEANSLPAPNGAFNLVMHLYGPKSEALAGKWNPPAVMKDKALPGISTQ